MTTATPDAPKDRLGRDIEVGDFIVYAGQQGQSSVLNYGKVIDLPVKSMSKVVAHAHRDSQGTFHPAVYQETPYYKLKVQPWDFNLDGPAQDWFSKRDSRPVILTFPDRTAVISN